jgi:hypothetical protein
MQISLTHLHTTPPFSLKSKEGEDMSKLASAALHSSFVVVRVFEANHEKYM